MAPAEHTTLKEGPFQAALADIAASENSHFKQFTVPLIREGIDLAQKSGSASMIDRAGSTAASGVLDDAMTQVKGAVRGLGLSGSGAGAGSGASLAADVAGRSAIAEGVGQAGFGARFGQRSAHLQGVQGGLALARGQQAEGQAGLGQIAGQQQRLAEQKVQANILGASAVGDGLGQAAGAGIGYFGLRKRAA